jgi:hypothetical protein
VYAGPSDFGLVASFCEHVNELTESRDGGDFFNQPKRYYFLKNDHAPWSYCIYKTVHEALAVNKWGCHAKTNFATRNTEAKYFSRHAIISRAQVLRLTSYVIRTTGK